MNVSKIHELRDRRTELRDKRDRLRTEMREIHERAGDRALTSGQQHRWNRLDAGVRSVEDDLEKLADEERDLVMGVASGSRGQNGFNGGPQVMRRVNPFDGADVGRLTDDEARDRALKALETRGQHLGTAEADQVDTLLRSRIDAKDKNLDGSYIARRLLHTESDDYRSAFARCLEAGLRGRAPVLSSAEADAMRDFERFEARAMSIGTDASGGFGVPVLIDPTIILTGQQSGVEIINLARVETITNDEWKGVTSAGVTWSFDAEATEVSDDSPTLSQPAIPVHKAQGFIPYSIEVGMDYPNLARELQTLLAEGYDELRAEMLTTGSGSGQPKGIVTALDASTTVEVASTTAGTIGAVDIYGLWDALPKRARRRAAWMSSQSVQNKVRQLSATSTGTQDANFTIDLTQETIQALFGRRYPVNDFMADAVTGTTSANLLIVGDWSRFVVAQRAGMNVEAVPHLFGTNRRPTGQRGLYAWARIGSDTVDLASFRLLQNKTS